MASTVLFVIVLYKIYCVVLYSRVLTLFEGESTLMEVQFLFLDRIKEFVVLEQVHLHSLSLITVPYTVRNVRPANEQSVLPGLLGHLIEYII